MSRGTRSQKIDRIARKLAKRYERLREQKGIRRRPLVRRGRKLKLVPFIAYDLETTRIEAGTPKPLYITAFSESFTFSKKLDSLEHLATILETRFLCEAFKGYRFVAWNGNNYDVYFIAAALLHTDRYILRPYLTRSKNLRGVRVVLKENEKLSWEFLDGISMTGLIGFPLKTRENEPDKKSFLKIFAPSFDRYDFRPDFDKIAFDPDDLAHIKYAEQDSEGLYWGLKAAQQVIVENFQMGLTPTIGNLGIKIFQMHLPDDVAVWETRLAVTNIIREQVMRGGFCHCARKFDGAVWKYDLNQAYAAAMRESLLPSGRCIHSEVYHPHAQTGIYRIRAQRKRNTIPFYYRDMSGNSVFGVDEIGETWITSIELKQLTAEKWNIQVLEGYFWDEFFTMKAYVDKLESLRMSAEDGPNGAQGTMMKMIGNNSYGKTVEQLDGVELIFANEKPDGWHDYNEPDDILRHIFFRFGEPMLKDYHQPQLGAFITAYVRMVVRRAALKCPQGWLYADTDCVVFDRPVDLPLDPKRYGFWKLEAENSPHIIVDKKVYATVDGKTKRAKGMNIRGLNILDFRKWYEGDSPVQVQIQRQNFVKVMTGSEMFVSRQKRGSAINRLTGDKKAA